MLTVGMVLSISVLLLGLLLYCLVPGEHAAVDLSLSTIPGELMKGNPIAVIDLGIILLIATPLTRVVTAMVIFARNHERRYFTASLLILVILAAAILLRL